MTTPEELETARRNLIRQFKAAVDGYVPEVMVGFKAMRSLVEVLEAVKSEPATLDRAAVDSALRKVISFADYDLHKGLEGDESGEDTYGEHVERFIRTYAEVKS